MFPDDFHSSETTDVMFSKEHVTVYFNIKGGKKSKTEFRVETSTPDPQTQVT